MRDLAGTGHFFFGVVLTGDSQHEPMEHPPIGTFRCPPGDPKQSPASRQTEEVEYTINGGREPQTEILDEVREVT